jgi:outer membrane protein OmpA-like peptidoglycan-associated protein
LPFKPEYFNIYTCLKEGFLKRFLLTAALAALAMNIYAGAELVGTTASNFIKIPPFARAVGMGEAFTAVSEGTYGLYYNPAGLSTVLGFEAQFTHIAWFQGINYEFLSAVTPVPFTDWGKLGFAFAWFQVDQMNKTGELPSYSSIPDNFDFTPYISGTFSPHDFAAILAYGLDIKENFSGGLSLKVVGQTIASYSGANLSADLGFMYRNMIGTHLMRAGLTVSNLGTDLKMKDTGFEPPKVLKLGLSDQFDILNGRFLVAAQAVVQMDYDSLFSVGAEYWIQNIACLRLGYELGAFNQPTFGAGIKYGNFEFDYAYEAYDELGNTHRFSMLYAWGTPPVKLQVSPYVFSPNGDTYMDVSSFIPLIRSRDRLSSMKINIFNQTGAPVASLPMKPSDKIVQWNGTDSSGAVLPDGVYQASLEAGFDSGSAESPKVNVEIDNTPPQAQVDGEPKLLKPGQKDSLLIPATFTLFAQDRNRIAKWYFMIWDSNKKPFYSQTGAGEPPLSIIWDGKGAAGDYVQTGQIYYYSLYAWDSVGNKTQTPVQAQVVLLREIKLSFSSDAIFDLGQADVKITAYGILKDMKKVIDRSPDSDIVVAGYTDNIQPRGIKYRDNIELSKSRADAVKFFMVNLLGMDEGRIKTEGYGEMHPIASNDTEEGRLKNRRVEITIKSTIYK